MTPTVTTTAATIREEIMELENEISWNRGHHDEAVIQRDRIVERMRRLGEECSILNARLVTAQRRLRREEGRRGEEVKAGVYRVKGKRWNCVVELSEYDGELCDQFEVMGSRAAYSLRNTDVLDCTFTPLVDPTPLVEALKTARAYVNNLMGMAKACGEKKYVTADDDVVDIRPPYCDLMYEVYPGGRIVAWGLADPKSVQSIKDFPVEDQRDFPMLEDHCTRMAERE